MDWGTFWVAFGGIVGFAGILCTLFLPSIRRGDKRRNERREDDITWNGRPASRGLAEVKPMWKRVDTIEKEYVTRHEFSELTELVMAIDNRTKTLEPDGNGGHSTYDLIRKVAEKLDIEIGEPK